MYLDTLVRGGSVEHVEGSESETLTGDGSEIF